MKKIKFLMMVIFLLSLVSVGIAQDISSGVVKVSRRTANYDYNIPYWTKKYNGEGNGTGYIIEWNGQPRIITNAHVVTNSIYIDINKYNEAKSFHAEVEFIANDVDIALLKISDPEDENEFFKNTHFFEFDKKLPKKGTPISVLGFSTLGNNLKEVDGIVSRYEYKTISHMKHRDDYKSLAMSVSAIIHAGNSGGPVVNKNNNKVVGIAFQGAKEGTVGHSIPLNTIRRFFADIEDGSYDGVPFINIDIYELTSEYIRKELQMDETDTGVFVEDLCSLDNYELQEGDILTHIDGVDIANDGTIQGPFGDRVLFRYQIKNKQIGDYVSLSIIRDGEKKNVDVKLGILQTTCPGPVFNEQPIFCMTSGVCFTKLTYNYHESDEGSFPTEEKKEEVKVSNVVPIKENKGYDWAEHKTVDTINGVKIREFKDVLEALEFPLEKEGRRYHKVIFTNDRFIILPACEEADLLDKEIKEDWSINSFKSKIFEEMEK